MSPAVKDIMEKIKEMDARERKTLIRGMIREGFFPEDVEDALVSESRKHESTVPAKDFFARLTDK